MTRTMLFALTASAAVAGTTYLYGQGTPVNLQPSTPGTQQVGNANVSGRIIAGSVHVTDPSPTGQAIVGSATSTTGANFGGFFRSDSPLGRALYGRASALSGTTHGVWGQADSPGGRGVTGVAPATTGNATGVWGQTASTTGRGVYGYTTSASGVNYGVMGQSSSPQGFGVYSQGNMHATGIISGNGAGLTNVNATTLGGKSPSDFLPSAMPLNLSGSDLFNLFSVTNYAGGAGTAIYGHSAASTGNGYGVFGRSEAPQSSGVLGIAGAVTGVNQGVQGRSDSPSGRGVYGWSVAASGGVGIYGEAFSASGVGAFGYANSGSGSTYGGRFRSLSTEGTGVLGEAFGATGVNYGVYGTSGSPSGFAGFFDGKGADALYVVNTGSGRGIRAVSTSDTAVWGITTSGFAGVDARTDNSAGFGMYARSNSLTGTNYGVAGTTSSGSFGVYSFGNMGASGTKPFRIDHPADPENKYLLHYSTESPTPQNFYTGNAKTDAQGKAWVVLPNYFAEINANFKYQLTVIDDTESQQFVQVKVGRKVSGNRFLIMSSVPNVEVSWRVDADRNDAWVRKYGAPTEVEKSEAERGTYQHPELYGVGPERAINYRQTHGAASPKPPVDPSLRSKSSR